MPSKKVGWIGGDAAAEVTKADAAVESEVSAVETDVKTDVAKL